MMKKERTWKNLGYDESNHGRFPEVCVAVFSNYSLDIKEPEPLFGKLRRNHKNIYRKLRKRDYSFTIFQKKDYELIQPRYKKLGVVLASLVYGKQLSDHLNVFVDGVWWRESEKYALGLLSDVTELPKDCIEFRTGAKFDRRLNLINLADETAHWILDRKINRNVSLKDLRKHPHSKQLRLEQFLPSIKGF